jgi:hypothetical protein
MSNQINTNSTMSNQTNTNSTMSNQTNTNPMIINTFLEKNQEPNIFPKKKELKYIFNDKNINRIKYKKQKKIFKRTHHIGRYKTKPQIGVLISNRTIRNRISTDAQLLKQTNIRDVRQFLIKKGFIKVGTNTPNDVLRKMYESVSLICGEIQNHNSENLLFNFIHDAK